MAFFTRRGTSSVPELPTATSTTATPMTTSATSTSNSSSTTTDDARQINYILDRDGVEV